MSRATVIKRCTKCGREKPLTGFFRGRKYRDGYKTQCKVCNAAYMRLWRRRNLEYARAKARFQNLKRRGYLAAYRRTPGYRRKQAVRKAAYWAVKAGVLPRKDRCQRCGAGAGGGQLQRHHPDYADPLRVEWLCGPCHVEEHRKARG